MTRTLFMATTCLYFLGLTVVSAQNTHSNNNMEQLHLTQEWDKTFHKSDKANHSKVTFINRYSPEAYIRTCMTKPTSFRSIN